MEFRPGCWAEEPLRGKSGGRTGIVLRVGPEGRKATWAEVLVVSVLHLGLQPPKLKTFERVRLRLATLRPFAGTRTCNAHQLENKFLEAMALTAEHCAEDGGESLGEGDLLERIRGERAPGYAVDYPAHLDSDFQDVPKCTEALLPVRSEKMATAQEWAEAAGGDHGPPTPSTPAAAATPMTWEVMSAQDCVVVSASGEALSRRQPEVETPPKPKRQRLEPDEKQLAEGAIHGLMHVRWFQGTKARQITGYKRKAQGLEVNSFPEGAAVKTFGLKNNLRFMLGDVTRVYTSKLKEGKVTAVAELRAGTFYLELSEADPAALEAFVGQCKCEIIGN